MKKLITFAAVIAMLFTFASFTASAEGTTFWLTHYDDNSVEGAGVIFTVSDGAGQWWHHFAFAPVKGTKDAYEIVNYSSASSGTAEPVEIPEGGFVYACNMGNNWPQLVADNNVKGDGATGLWYDDEMHVNMPNYISNGINDMWGVIANWSVGDQFVIHGLDLEGFTVPTSTPDKEWYEDGYVCTATFEVYDGSNATPDDGGAGTGTGEDSKTEESKPEESKAEESKAEESKAGTDESKPEETSKDDGNTEESKAVIAPESAAEGESAAAGSEAEPASSGSNTWIWIVIACAAVVVIAVAAALIAKKKKK